jgi:hypothetical protein
MEPVAGNGKTDLPARIDSKSGSVSVEKEGVTIRLTPFSTVDLAHFTEDSDINPYIQVGFWGKVEPLYTVFEISVENNRDSRVELNAPAILIDASGEQYVSLPYDYFRDIYQPYHYERTETYDYWSHYSPYYPYRRYYGYGYYPWRPYYGPYSRTYIYSNLGEQDKKQVIKDTIFDGAKLFPGAKRKGLLVFNRVDLAARDLQIVIPEVKIYKGQKRSKEIKFEFEFRQMVEGKRRAKY